MKELHNCSVCNVDSSVKKVYKCKKYNNQYLCEKHCLQLYNYGYFKDKNMRGIFECNEVRENENIIEVDCYNSLGDIVGTFITNKEYKNYVCSKKWRLTKKKEKLYVITGNQKSEIIYLHRYIMNFPFNEVDHINGNSLDNRKENLREATRQEQFLNISVQKRSKTGIRGISYSTKDNNFVVDFTYLKTRLYFKRFNTIEEACYVRNFLENIFIGDKRNIKQKNLLENNIQNLNIEKQDELKQYILNKYRDISVLERSR